MGAECHAIDRAQSETLALALDTGLNAQEAHRIRVYNVLRHVFMQNWILAFAGTT